LAFASIGHEFAGRRIFDLSTLFRITHVALAGSIVLSFALGAFIMSQVAPPNIAILTSFMVIPLVIQELAIGLTAGLTFMIIFATAGLAGEKIAASSGLSFSMQVDPSGSGQTPW